MICLIFGLIFGVPALGYLGVLILTRKRRRVFVQTLQDDRVPWLRVSLKAHVRVDPKGRITVLLSYFETQQSIAAGRYLPMFHFERADHDVVFNSHRFELVGWQLDEHHAWNVQAHRLVIEIAPGDISVVWLHLRWDGAKHMEIAFGVAEHSQTVPWQPMDLTKKLDAVFDVGDMLTGTGGQ